MLFAACTEMNSHNNSDSVSDSLPVHFHTQTDISDRNVLRGKRKKQTRFIVGACEVGAKKFSSF